jgi:hypothetical protein
MSERVILELPELITERARALAHQTQRRFEDILVEWLRHGATDMPLEQLPDDQILSLRDSTMDARQQRQLTRLLARQREGTLSAAQHTQLDTLMGIYRHGMVRKAHALKIAVERGLQAPIG